MFCNQCEEAMGNVGCNLFGFCGKDETTSNLQDLLIYSLKGLSFYEKKLRELNVFDYSNYDFLMDSLFSTITNVNFDSDRFYIFIEEALRRRDQKKEKFFELYKEKRGKALEESLPDCARFTANRDEYLKKANEIEVPTDKDKKSLSELLLYGLKGIAAYAHHASVLGYKNEKIYDFLIDALYFISVNSSVEELLNMVMKAGEVAVETMALLDEANTKTFGNPEISEVNLGVGNNPGILVSGHDLKDLKELLLQTQGTNVDVYTHSEMLPAHYYPYFKKFNNLIGNYGSSWWLQEREFEAFNGPILMTTNCLVPPRDSAKYLSRLFTTSVVGLKGAKHIEEKEGKKDFSEIIEMAKKCSPPTEIENGKIIGGFAHHQLLSLSDKIIDAVKKGMIKRFVVMAGCDGRKSKREYFSDLAKAFPQDTLILTAGCAKYRYIKLPLGSINGIPRVLDAGQCNDSYSLALVALKLKEILNLSDINDLPISYDIAWYEQKAVAVLLALLYLGVKRIRLGPTLPAFLSKNVLDILVDRFEIKTITTVEDDLPLILAGK